MKSAKAVEIKEFNLNYTDCDDMVSVTAFQKKMVNRLVKLAEIHDDIRIVAKNPDGTIVAHLPKKYVFVRFGEERVSQKRELTDEQKIALSERMKKMQESRKAKSIDKEGR